jgi:hypothetical protein
MKVKPAGPDRAVPYPGTNTLLPAEGAVVPDNTYWRRRLRGGDVVLLDDRPVEEHPPAPQPLTPPRRP